MNDTNDTISVESEYGECLIVLQADTVETGYYDAATDDVLPLTFAESEGLDA